MELKKQLLKTIKETGAIHLPVLLDSYVNSEDISKQGDLLTALYELQYQNHIEIIKYYNSEVVVSNHRVLL